MKIGLVILSAVIAFGLSGCGSNPKSVEELSKNSIEELNSMFSTCKVKQDELFKDEARANEIFKILGNIAADVEGKTVSEKEAIQAGQLVLLFGLGNLDISDEVISKFGNKEFSEFVECNRIYKVLDKKKRESR